MNNDLDKLKPTLDDYGNIHTNSSSILKYNGDIIGRTGFNIRGHFICFSFAYDADNTLGNLSIDNIIMTDEFSNVENLYRTDHSPFIELSSTGNSLNIINKFGRQCMISSIIFKL